MLSLPSAEYGSRFSRTDWPLLFISPRPAAITQALRLSSMDTIVWTYNRQ